VRRRLADLPVVSAEPDTLGSVLRELIRDPMRRTVLGAQGETYVYRMHDTRVVGEQLLRTYREILGRDRSAIGAPA